MAQSTALLLLLAACVLGASAKHCDDSNNGQCTSSSTFCWDGAEYECANSNFRCLGKFGPCQSTKTYPRLPGHWKRYSCLNNDNFANGRYVMTCAPGTQCWAVKGNISPCLKKKHRGDCPNGNGGCIDDKTYCENGQHYRCPSGLRCAGPATSPLNESYGKGVVAPCAKKL